jgi:hypothetical protein
MSRKRQTDKRRSKQDFATCMQKQQLFAPFRQHETLLLLASKQVHLTSYPQNQYIYNFVIKL